MSKYPRPKKSPGRSTHKERPKGLDSASEGTKKSFTKSVRYNYIDRMGDSVRKQRATKRRNNRTK